MVWFFERQQSRLHYEIRRQSDGDDYELVINWPDGRQEVERYSECGTLIAAVQPAPDPAGGTGVGPAADTGAYRVAAASRSY